MHRAPRCCLVAGAGTTQHWLPRLHRTLPQPTPFRATGALRRPHRTPPPLCHVASFSCCTRLAAANFGGVGLNTAVAVADRPVTRQGMGGMRVKTAGPGRQVQDVSFFHGLLRKRVADLVAELGRMRTEMGERSKNKATQQVSWS